LGFLSSAQPTNIIRKTLKYEQYKNKKIKTDGNSKAEIEIVNLSTNNSIYSQKNVDLVLRNFSYLAVGYYDEPNYGKNWSPIRIDNILIKY
jgi:hypothetical protein